jgi:hypothetical protein
VKISQAKLSNIETGKQRNLDSTLLQSLLAILKPSIETTQQLLTELESSRKMESSITHDIDKWSHDKALEIENSTQQFDFFTLALIPSLLQTLEYRAGFLKKYDVGNADIQFDVKKILTRQDNLWDPKKNFHFLLHEAALYTLPAGRDPQLQQLDRLERIMTQPNIRIGIIPLEAGGSYGEHGNFVIYDNSRLVITLPGMDLFPKDQYLPGHQRVFQELANLAWHEDKARGLIRKAVDYLITR